MVHYHIKRLCSELLKDAVALVDAFAPPDFILKSALGNADGQVNFISCDMKYSSGTCSFTNIVLI